MARRFGCGTKLLAVARRFGCETKLLAVSVELRGSAGC